MHEPITTRGSRGPQRRAIATLLTICLALPSCSAWLFSGDRRADRSRPVARIETQGGTELGAGTEHGVLFLGRTAQSGPCRVSWLLGDTVFEEEGEISPYGGVFFRADIDLRTQMAPLLKRRPTPEDELQAMVPILNGGGVESVAVELVDEGGSMLRWPGQTLPAGTPVFTGGDRPHLVGLVAAELTMGGERQLVLAGLDQLREAWLLPREYPSPQEIEYRPDDLIIRKSGDTLLPPKR